MEHLLDLGRVDVLAAADYHIVRPPQELEVAVLVLTHEVAGDEPLPVEDLVVRRRQFVVALEHGGAPVGDPPDLALFDLRTVLVDQFHADIEQRATDRLDLIEGVLGWQDERQRRQLRLAEHLGEATVEGVDDVALEFRLRGRRPGPVPPERGEVVVLDVRLKERPTLGRHHERPRHLFVLDYFEYVVRVEVRRQHGRRADVERIEEQRERRDVEQRRHDQEPLVTVQADVVDRVLGVLEEVIVGEQAALRPPGRAARVQHRGPVESRDVRLRRRLRSRLAERLV
jgi:hypothetical protein